MIFNLLPVLYYHKLTITCHDIPRKHTKNTTFLTGFPQLKILCGDAHSPEYKL